MPIRTTRWPLQPHTAIKHRILECYLEAWLPILGRWNGRIVFVDGFAGPGRYSNGEPGSPLIALDALLKHRYFEDNQKRREVVFVFIEQDSRRAGALQQEIESIDYPDWIQIEVLEGAFVDHMSEILDLLDASGQRLAPSFVFIDPFGFKGLPLTLIARILQNPKCECLISFMYESINRFLSHPDPGIQSLMDELFGTDRWREIADIVDPAVRKDRLLQLYTSQLKAAASLSHARIFEMINEGNRTEYFLIFGTKSDLGLSKMKEAMWRVDPSAGTMFSDRSDCSQLVLFEATPDLGILRDQLLAQFQGKGAVGIDEVADYVLRATAFSETKHLRRATLGPMEKLGVIEVRRPLGRRNRPGEYPPGTRIEFLGSEE